MRFFPRALALGAVAVATLAGCGSDDSPAADTTGAPAGSTAVASSPTTGSGNTVVVGTAPEDVPGGSVAPGDAPQRIVSLSATSTETLFAIGAGDQVIAVDQQSNFPAEAATKQALSSFPPNVEAIAALEPDLVVHDGTADISAPLEALGIETFEATAPETIDEIYHQIEQLGAVTGHGAQAADVVEEMEAGIGKAVDSVTVLFEVPPRLYHELDDTYYSINSNTFIGAVYSLFGLHNIADTAEGGTNYPQLNAEFIVSQNPDIIFLADSICCGETPEKVAARPGWDAITAVKTGKIIPVDEDIASRWGPRLVQYVEFVAETLNGLGTPGG